MSITPIVSNCILSLALCIGICGNVHAKNTISKGALLLTFDDCDVNGWLDAIPLFKQYHGHATFFFSGEMNEVKIDCIKKLQAAGHSVGLHTLNHADAPKFIQDHGEETFLSQQIAPQLSPLNKAGIEIHNFAFPNNRMDDRSLTLLKKYFKRFRVGAGAKLIEPDSKAYEKAFFPVSELPDKIVFGGFGVGEHYKTQKKDLLDAIEKISKENKVLVIYSHKIAPNAKHVHMPLEMLTDALAKADSLGVKILGFDDL